MKTKTTSDRRKNVTMRYIVESVICSARATTIANAAKLAVQYDIPLKVTYRVLATDQQWKIKQKHEERRTIRDKEEKTLNPPTQENNI